MTAYAIMRSKKLKHMGNVAASLKHAYREIETLNADAEKTPENEQLISGSVDEAMGKLRENLPEKRRKDAVLAVEYVMTASPEWWQTADKEAKSAFVKQSMDWLKAKYGKANVVAAVVHNDEKSPHVSAFVTPVTRDGRLSAKEYIGNRAKMKADQTAYAAAVADLGLERGVEGSKAKHQSVQRYYTQIERETPLPKIDIPKVKSFESRDKYGHRVAESVIEQMKPAWENMQAKAAEGTQNAVRAAEGQKTAKYIEKRLQRSQALLKAARDDNKKLQAPFVGLSREQVRPLIEKAQQMQQQNAQEKKRQKDLGRDLGR